MLLYLGVTIMIMNNVNEIINSAFVNIETTRSIANKYPVMPVMFNIFSQSGKCSELLETVQLVYVVSAI